MSVRTGFPREGARDRRTALGGIERGPDRRVDCYCRKLVAEMSPEEMQRALMRHELTGLRNRRAYQEAEKLPVQAAIDADSLKWFNDAMGHEAGDHALRAIASAFDAVTVEAYHIGGDEFLVQGRSEDEVRRVILRARRLLRRVTIGARLADGTVIRKTGVEISYGIGHSRADSERALSQAKQARRESGARAARGEAPRRGVVRVSAGRGAGDTAGTRVSTTTRAPHRRGNWLRRWWPGRA
jgi:diguanylate cyclase (GGDEF)-like protein